MTSDAQSAPVQHLIGLALAGLLGWACYGLYLYVPVWIQGTALQSLGNLVTFVAVIAGLSAAEWVWVYVGGLLQRRLPP